MQDVTDGNINCVIVKDLSRLGREYIETGRYLRRVFPAYGVRFIAITDTGADLYYDRVEQELYATVQFPVPLDSAASRYQGTDYSDLDGDGNSDLQMSFDQDGEYETYVWYWNTVRGEFMDTLAD